MGIINNSTINQVHGVTDAIRKDYDVNKICSDMFLDVAQTFDKVWHEGLMHKLKYMLSK